MSKQEPLIIETRTLAVNQDVEFEALGFEPLWWVIIPERAIPEGKVRAYLGAANRGGGIPIAGSTPSTLPARERKMIVRNAGPATYDVTVMCGTGLQPVIGAPVSEAALESPDILAQTRFEAYGSIANPATFTHAHIGYWIVIAIADGLTGTDTSTRPAVTSVLVNGVAATLLGMGDSEDVGGLRNQEASFWRVAAVAEGEVSIAVTRSSLHTTEYLYVYVFSYAEQIRTGNVVVQEYVGATPPPFFILGQDDGSYVYSVLAAYGGTMTETSGADAFDAIHTLGGTGQFGLHRHTGKGSLTFDYAAAASVQMAAVALEVLPR